MSSADVGSVRNGEVSWWWRALGGFPVRRSSLPGPEEADVCIVGGGYTGLWTAYYLKGARPDLRVVVLEGAFAGFGEGGASGATTDLARAIGRAVLASPMPSRRLRTSPRVGKRAIAKYNARGNVDRATYEATIAIEILTPGQEP
jgi:FAD dependent oxidoreductase